MQLGPNFKLGTLLLLVVFAISVAALFGGAQLVKDDSQASASGGEGPNGGGGSGGGPVAVRIVAKDLKFDKRSFAASPGASISVTLDNQDAGVLHNIAFYTNNRATTKIAGSDPAGGPVTQEVKFSAPSAPGNYFYRCDVHPDTMTGTLTVR